jgi:uncharacterized membrane protein
MRVFFNFIAFGLILPFIIWLLYNGPNLRNTANLFIFGMVVVHLYFLIWGRLIFKILKGDIYTYNIINFGINLFSFIITVIGGFYLFIFYMPIIGFQSLSEIPKYYIGYVLVSIFGCLVIPLLTPEPVDKLTKKSDRREYEVPSEETR